MARLTDEQAALFRDKNYAVLATLRPDGSPQQTATWIDWDGENVVFNITDSRKKYAYLQRDPRATVLVFAGDDPYTWVSVSGPVELSYDGAEEHINELSHRYRDRDYSYREGERRVIGRLAPERVTAYGFDDS